MLDHSSLPSVYTNKDKLIPSASRAKGVLLECCCLSRHLSALPVGKGVLQGQSPCLCCNASGGC